MKKTLFFAGAALMLASCTLPVVAAPTKSKAPAKAPAKTSKAKITEVKICPMTMEAVVGKGSGSEVVGNKRVYFCCAGCQPAFNGLSKAEQEKKVKAAVAKQKSSKKNG